MRIPVAVSLLLTLVASVSAGEVLPSSESLDALAALAGATGPLALTPYAASDTAVLAVVTDAQGAKAGLALFAREGERLRLAEAVFDVAAALALETGAKAAAQRAVGTKKALGEPAFSHDGLLSYSLIYPFADIATGKSEGKVSIDVLSGRLSLPGRPAAGIGAPSGESGAPAAAILLPVQRLVLRTGLRQTTLAMLFDYWGEHGFPAVGRKKTDKGVQTDDEYIDEFSKACGACSERSATEIFVTSRKMLADIKTWRVSSEHAIQDLADKILAELAAGRPVYARTSAANVNHYFVICGRSAEPDGLFLVARIAASDASAAGSSGYAVFRLPAGFDSAELTGVEVKADRQTK
jgi:hypothetical protein